MHQHQLCKANNRPRSRHLAEEYPPKASSKLFESLTQSHNEPNKQVKEYSINLFWGLEESPLGRLPGSICSSPPTQHNTTAREREQQHKKTTNHQTPHAQPPSRPATCALLKTGIDPTRRRRRRRRPRLLGAYVQCNDAADRRARAGGKPPYSRRIRCPLPRRTRGVAIDRSIAGCRARRLTCVARARVPHAGCLTCVAGGSFCVRSARARARTPAATVGSHGCRLVLYATYVVVHVWSIICCIEYGLVVVVDWRTS